MGTDVHAVAQAKTPEGWKDVPCEWDQHRHYFLFSWIANVRNGYGFAGVVTYAPIKPIAEPRGLPDDFVRDNEEHPTTTDALCAHHLEYMSEAEKAAPTCWMGDHSHSWLTFDEILSTPTPGGVWRTGVVTREAFEAWDGVSQPEDWSGGIAGRDIRVAASPAMVEKDSTHVQICWKAPDNALDYFVNEVKRLKEAHGEGRLVFGFDS